MTSKADTDSDHAVAKMHLFIWGFTALWFYSESHGQPMEDFACRVNMAGMLRIICRGTKAKTKRPGRRL